MVWPFPVFTADGYTLTVNIVGDGSVTNNPDQATYHYGDVVTLTATADPGWTFSAVAYNTPSTPLSTVGILFIRTAKLAGIHHGRHQRHRSGRVLSLRHPLPAGDVGKGAALGSGWQLR